VADNQGASTSKVKISRFDVSEHLDSEEVIAAYLNAALEEGDSDLLMAAIADIAKARGIAKVAADAGVGRESLHKTLAPGSKPKLETVFKSMRALGVKLPLCRKQPTRSLKNGSRLPSEHALQAHERPKRNTLPFPGIL
jgi:probable addiction module antidote protein